VQSSKPYAWYLQGPEPGKKAKLSPYQSLLLLFPRVVEMALEMQRSNGATNKPKCAEKAAVTIQKAPSPAVARTGPGGRQ
jgi:hypothetical protein